MHDRIRYLTCVLLTVGCGLVARTGHAAAVRIDHRVIANRPDDVWVLRVRNDATQEVRIRDLFVYYCRVLEFGGTIPVWHRDEVTGPPPMSTLQAGEMRERIHPNISGLRWYNPGRYTVWHWRGALVDAPPDVQLDTSAPVIIGYIKHGGDIAPPSARGESGVISNLLAFVFHQNRYQEDRRQGPRIEDVPPHELAFLLLNGTDGPLDMIAPLTADSRLHVSAPGIGYSTDITLPDSGFDAQTVEPGESAQWRIPFERILEQIPAETVESIRASDGALDVVWRTGDLESPPLPLILLPPTQAERDAAFLAEHADVPRIDEQTDLSLDLRLAGIENEPVLLGRLRNNAPHSVMMDRTLRHSMLISTLESHHFHREGKRSQLNIIEPKQTANFSASLRTLVPDIPNGEPTGRLICFQWFSVRNFSQSIWLTFGGEPDRIERIHTFAEKYLPSSEYHRPDLPPIAPLLAYIHNPDTPPELTCVLWNRTEEAIDVADTRIVVTAPAIDYRRELALPTALDLPATVAPDEHTDWRINWQSIRDMIPADDLARIEAAGGELDLVWQVNGLASPPLPLLLGWDGQAE